MRRIDAWGRAGGGALLAAALLAAPAAPAGSTPRRLPFERTEAREDCADFDPLRNPYFGETHIHTRYSFDAFINGTRAEPRDAYRFAQGGEVALPPFDAQGRPTRVARLRRPLDFTVVTDHAEQFGEVDICRSPGLPGSDAPECERMRGAVGTVVPGPIDATGATTIFGFVYTTLPEPFRFPTICGADGARCRAAASLVWRATRDQAEEFYDRTAACRFTTFVGYEWTAGTVLANLHRNVIFRNAVVPELPISYLEANTVQELWAGLQRECLDGLPGCDTFAIPHNSNVSQGFMFATESPSTPIPPTPPVPLDATEAAVRAALEPLVEITQHKGDSECRPGILSNDELCAYEKMRRIDLAAQLDPDSLLRFPFGPLAFVRNVLKEGLVQEQALGVNPFRLGLIGSTDGHVGTPGAVHEQDFSRIGHLGSQDATPEFLLSRRPIGGIEANPGGLAVVWAEENSRDALFAAMRRREVYGTSGTRPIVRFFGGFRLPANLCRNPNFVKQGYQHGVPMGGVLGPPPGRGRGRMPAPRFAVLALRDPGEAGTALQRIQIVKGWLDAGGGAQEKVFDVAGDPANGADVDLSTCQPRGTGFGQLCTVWEDPEFERGQRAFYYARVLENPTCRWSTHLCNELRVDCRDPASVPPAFETCCDPAFPKTIQERAWTSPIWYRPEGAS